MPITINDVDARIDVDAPPGEAPSEPQEDPREALQRLADQARQLNQREARTSAWNFDD